MVQQSRLTFIWATVSAIILLLAEIVVGQCTGNPIKIEHTSGTATVGCGTAVTVTSDGYATSILQGPMCLYGPYRVGYQNIPGSYTFSFSLPVQEVVIDVQFLDNYPGLILEEMAVEVNGAFYPLPSPGMPDGCNEPAMLSATGTVIAPPGKVGSSKNITITGSITSIKVSDIVVLGNPHGFAFNFFVCCAACTTDAGMLNPNDIVACVNKPAEIPPTSQSTLDLNDMLQYILVSDPFNPTLSILATSNTPSINFDPSTMVVGETYYIAAIAGNELNGSVDFSDPCWDITNLVLLVWWPAPTVEFATPTVDCLLPGGCYPVNLSFTGNPPFHLTGQVVAGGNVITNFGDIYSLPTAEMVLCLPSNTPQGQLTMQAVSLSDEHCICD